MNLHKKKNDTIFIAQDLTALSGNQFTQPVILAIINKPALK